MRVLLAEDDQRITNFIAKGLRENAYAVDTANDGEDALYQISINTYDVIILDVMMPKINGLNVFSELRKNEIRQFGMSAFWR